MINLFNMVSKIEQKDRHKFPIDLHSRIIFQLDNIVDSLNERASPSIKSYWKYMIILSQTKWTTMYFFLLSSLKRVELTNIKNILSCFKVENNVIYWTRRVVNTRKRNSDFCTENGKEVWYKKSSHQTFHMYEHNLETKSLTYQYFIK